MAVAHWMKQAVALACGVFFGITGAEGWNPILSFLGLLAVTSYGTIRMAADVSIDEQADVLKEGMPTAIALFFLSW
eukprot:CAMPEP_0115852174 /NCGR_PEP_ID=MMETSP0287-20121206/12859_1 /TAXON_ID=412157 /ORGANISM="Chrysochromulina rotalis, Strain UIO044" /LENGTH=75 /DNA_ID=CAMNT_0003306225 /DNA_START=101 /DNA_END=325 /DNA_ORIENTATION=+